MQIADLPSLALCTMHLMSQPWKQFREITIPWKITWPKWNHLWYRWKQDDCFGFQHGRRSRKRIIEQVYGLNIEGWAREILTDYNLILLIMSYPINGARVDVQTGMNFPRAIYMRIWNMHLWFSLFLSSTPWLKYRSVLPLPNGQNDFPSNWVSTELNP